MHPSLNLRDFQLLTELSHFSSLRALSRAMKIQPQHLSKLIVSLEEKCGAKLLNRSPRGVSLTPEAIRFASLGEKLMADVRDFAEETREVKAPIKPVTIVSRVFMNVCFSPIFSRMVNQEFPQIRLRFVDASPKKKEQWAREGIVDLVMSLGRLDLGRAWQEEQVGLMEWGFFSRSGHPLGRNPSKERLVLYPLIAHAHIDGSRMVESLVTNPYKLEFRKVGSSTETALSTIQILQETDQVAYLPNFLVQETSASALQRLQISGLEPQRQDVYLYAQGDRVPMPLYRKMLLAARSALKG